MFRERKREIHGRCGDVSEPQNRQDTDSASYGIFEPCDTKILRGFNRNIERPSPFCPFCVFLMKCKYPRNRIANSNNALEIYIIIIYNAYLHKQSSYYLTTHTPTHTHKYTITYSYVLLYTCIAVYTYKCMLACACQWRWWSNFFAIFRKCSLLFLFFLFFSLSSFFCFIYYYSYHPFCLFRFNMYLACH